jgi:hypothetical protein
MTLFIKRYELDFTRHPYECSCKNCLEFENYARSNGIDADYIAWANQETGEEVNQAECR